MYFAYGWPRVLAGIRDPYQRDIIYSSLKGEYLVLVSNSAIQIWTGGQDRVQLGTYVTPQPLVESEGENFAACWNGARNVLAVLVRSTTILDDLPCPRYLPLSAPPSHGAARS
jgi:hypothetical protein